MNNMVLTTFVANTDAVASEVNGNFNESFTIQGLNHIRQLIDRAGVYSKGMNDLWGEAYPNVQGSNMSLVKTGTTASYRLSSYAPYKNMQGETTHLPTPNDVDDPESAFDFRNSTSCYLSWEDTGETNAIGKTFDSQYITDVYLNMSDDCTYTVQTYNGSTWTNIFTGSLSTGVSEVVVPVNATTQGVRVRNTDGNDNLRVYEMVIRGAPQTSQIVHTIPRGTFNHNISAAIGVPMITDYETGADIKYKFLSVTSTDVGNNFVVIEATNLTPSNFAINNCLITSIGTGKWALYCTTGTDEVRRAQIYKTLFYGSTGSDPRVTSTYINGLTALKTTVARDVGKRATYAALSNGLNVAATYTGTFTNTTTNNSCSVWSTCLGNTTVMDASFEMPSGTTINESLNSTAVDETGTDKTADELNNPATVQLEIVDAGSYAADVGYVRCYILSVDALTWAKTGTATESSNDFYVINSVPLFTAVTETVTNNDTGWLSCGTSPTISSFTPFTSEPTSLIVQLIPKSTSPTAGFPSIRGFAVRAT